jgi:hypothetical protein
MDNKINKIRKQIRLLRCKMLEAEASMRDQIRHDLDCSETAVRLMAMRSEMVGLTEQRAALGDSREPIEIERLVQSRRTTDARKARGVPAGRR